MYEKEIFQLKQTHQEFQRQLYDVYKRISEINVVSQDVKSKAAIISYLDEFKNNQILKNTDFNNLFNNLKEDIRLTTNYVQGNIKKTIDLSVEISDLKNEISTLKEETKNLKNIIYSFTYDCQIKDLKSIIENKYSELNSLINKINEEFSKPLTDVKKTHESVLTSSNSASKLSEESQKISEQVSVEVRVLNWKLNEILHRLGHQGF